MIEIKIGNDRMSKWQKQTQKQVEAAGGCYVVATNWEGFKKWYDNFLN